MTALVFALLSSGIGSLVHISRHLYNTYHDDWQRDYGGILSSMTMVYGSFATLPTFVMVFVLNNEIGRWRSIVQVPPGGGGGPEGTCGVAGGRRGARLCSRGLGALCSFAVLWGRCGAAPLR